MTRYIIISRWEEKEHVRSSLSSCLQPRGTSLNCSPECREDEKFRETYLSLSIGEVFCFVTPQQLRNEERNLQLSFVVCSLFSLLSTRLLRPPLHQTKEIDDKKMIRQLNSSCLLSALVKLRWFLSDIDHPRCPSIRFSSSRVSIKRMDEFIFEDTQTAISFFSHSWDTCIRIVFNRDLPSS